MGLHRSANVQPLQSTNPPAKGSKGSKGAGAGDESSVERYARASFDREEQQRLDRAIPRANQPRLRTISVALCEQYKWMIPWRYFKVLANEVAISFLNSDPNSYHGDRPSHQIFCCPLGCPKYFSGEGPLQQHLATTAQPGHPGPAALALWGIDTGSGSGAMLVARDVEINLT